MCGGGGVDAHTNINIKQQQQQLGGSLKNYTSLACARLVSICYLRGVIIKVSRRRLRIVRRPQSMRTKRCIYCCACAVRSEIDGSNGRARAHKFITFNLLLLYIGLNSRVCVLNVYYMTIDCICVCGILINDYLNWAQWRSYDAMMMKFECNMLARILILPSHDRLLKIFYCL